MRLLLWIPYYLVPIQPNSRHSTDPEQSLAGQGAGCSGTEVLLSGAHSSPSSRAAAQRHDPARGFSLLSFAELPWAATGASPPGDDSCTRTSTCCQQALQAKIPGSADKSLISERESWWKSASLIKAQALTQVAVQELD